MGNMWNSQFELRAYDWGSENHICLYFELGIVSRQNGKYKNMVVCLTTEILMS